MGIFQPGLVAGVEYQVRLQHVRPHRVPRPLCLVHRRQSARLLRQRPLANPGRSVNLRPIALLSASRVPTPAEWNFANQYLRADRYPGPRR